MAFPNTQESGWRIVALTAASKKFRPKFFPRASEDDVHSSFGSAVTKRSRRGERSARSAGRENREKTGSGGAGLRAGGGVSAGRDRETGGGVSAGRDRERDSGAGRDREMLQPILARLCELCRLES